MSVLRLYQSVSANSTASDSHTPADGEEIHFTKFLGSGIYCSADVKTEVYWGSELLYASHGQGVEEYIEKGSHRVLEERTGDGSTQIIVKLTNDTSAAETIGGAVYWE